MAVQICIEMTRGTYFQLAANHFYGVVTSSIQQIEVYFRGCTVTLANIPNPTRLHVSALSRLKYVNNGIQIDIFCFKVFYAS